MNEELKRPLDVRERIKRLPNFSKEEMNVGLITLLEDLTNESKIFGDSVFPEGRAVVLLPAVRREELKFPKVQAKKVGDELSFLVSTANEITFYRVQLEDGEKGYQIKGKIEQVIKGQKPEALSLEQANNSLRHIISSLGVRLGVLFDRLSIKEGQTREDPWRGLQRFIVRRSLYKSDRTLDMDLLDIAKETLAKAHNTTKERVYTGLRFEVLKLKKPKDGQTVEAVGVDENGYKFNGKFTFEGGSDAGVSMSAGSLKLKKPESDEWEEMPEEFNLYFGAEVRRALAIEMSNDPIVRKGITDQNDRKEYNASEAGQRAKALNQELLTEYHKKVKVGKVKEKKFQRGDWPFDYDS